MAKIDVTIDKNELWKLDASCVGLDVDLFFPEGPGTTTEVSHIKRMCFACPVQNACLDYALNNFEYEGWWGGYSPNERRVIKKGRRSASKTN